ncbi:MAG TPA: hypothetical protein VKW04_15665 [Planctomycetota bacterium]|nr:hypothetical protein [Planctomycetota bacterium]
MSIGSRLGVAGLLALGMGVAAWGSRASLGEQDASKAQADDLTALRADVARLKGLVPDQSHAMADVGFHFTNLWFAGQNENWPLATFYSDELRSHLRWAVRIIPKRKDAEGREIDLGGILGGLETSTLKDLAEAIKAKEKEKFVAAYKAQMEGCMACHRATNKPYLRLHVPERPDAGIIEFRPE